MMRSRIKTTKKKIKISSPCKIEFCVQSIIDILMFHECGMLVDMYLILAIEGYLHDDQIKASSSSSSLSNGDDDDQIDDDDDDDDLPGLPTKAKRRIGSKRETASTSR